MQLCIFKARLTKIEMLKDKKHDRIRKLEKTGKKHIKRRAVSVIYMFFFTNMVAETLWNKKFKPGFLALKKSVASDNDRYVHVQIRSKTDGKRICFDLINQRFSTKKAMNKVCTIYIFVFFLFVSR